MLTLTVYNAVIGSSENSTWMDPKSPSAAMPTTPWCSRMMGGACRERMRCCVVENDSYVL